MRARILSSPVFSRPRRLLLPGAPTATPPGATAAGPVHHRTGATLTVFAAASLKPPSPPSANLRDRESRVTVTFTFAGSSDLVTQLIDGAPADVFAAADTTNMDKVTDGLGGHPVDFAAQHPDHRHAARKPGGNQHFRRPRGARVSVVVCADGVPCGSATARSRKPPASP